MRAINSKSVKVSMSKMEIDRDLEIDQEVVLEIKGQVVQKIIGSNQDGTDQICWVVKGESVLIK